MAPLRIGRRTVRQRWGFTASAALLAVACLFVLAGALAVNPSANPPGLFELDGNALASNAQGDDWQNIVPPPGTGTTQGASFIAATFIGQTVENDTVDTTYFTGGGSKDTNNVSQWRHNGPGAPDKNQITNAYAAAYSKDGRQYIYFGADRISNDGDSALGFWFFKSSVSLGPNGTFNGNHVDGDLFVVSDFSNGGAVGTINVFRWTGGANGSLTGPVAGGVGGDCATAPASANVCARVNGSPSTAPWPYTPKPNVGSPGTFPSNTFFEGGLDLTSFTGGSTCLSSFMAETRTSTTPNAQLKDLALGGFNTCDARISIGNDDTNGIGDSHTFTVTTENSTGGGVFSPASGVTVNASLVAGSVGSITGGTCTNGTTNASGQCTVIVNSLVPGTTTVTASASIPTQGGGSLLRTTNGQGGNSAPAVKTFVAGTLRWLKHDHNGALLGGATFQVCRTHRFDSDTLAMVDITDECQPVTDDSAPDSDPTGGELQLSDVLLGTYTIQETQAPPGYAIDPSTETVELTIANPSNAANPPIFVNVRQFKMIILTCNEATNELVVSSVDLAGDVKDTLASPPAGISHADLCGLGGASYGALDAGTFNPSVVIPKP